MTDYAEGDINSEEPGTCARANSGKVQFHLLPLAAMAGAARVMMAGAAKYAPWNWAKGGKWSTPFDCTLRHLFKWWFCGEDVDTESGQHHLDHVLCNVLFMRHYTQTYTEGDDRPPNSAAMGPWLEDINRAFASGSVSRNAPPKKVRCWNGFPIQCVSCGKVCKRTPNSILPSMLDSG